MPQGFDLDVFISVAREDRDIARRLHELLQERKVVSFYDKYYKSLLWGESLAYQFRSICCRARFFIPIVESPEITQALAGAKARTGKR